MFQQRFSTSNYSIRNFRNLHIPKLNLELTKKGFHYSGIKAWNEYPKLNLELTKKEFHYSGIKAWNDIPVNIRELPSITTNW